MSTAGGNFDGQAYNLGPEDSIQAQDNVGAAGMRRKLFDPHRNSQLLLQLLGYGGLPQYPQETPDQFLSPYERALKMKQAAL